MKKVTLVLMTHDTRKDDLISLIKAHLMECSSLVLISSVEYANIIHSQAGLAVFGLWANYLDIGQQIRDLVAKKEVSAVIYLRDQAKLINEDIDLLSLYQTCDENDVPLATNIASSEAILHLLSEHPEALTGHHMAAQYLEDIAMTHD